MISVQNHRRQLNGNSLVLILILFLFTQCKTSQISTRGSTKPQVERPTSPPIDTVKWTDPGKDEVVKIDPNIDPTSNQRNLNAGMLGLILPLNAISMNFQSDRISSRDNAMLHYYHGILFGLKQLESTGLDLEVFIEDSEEDESRLDDLLNKLKRQKVKYIFGGKGKTHVEQIANFSLENDMYYMSGWQANSKFINKNDHYIQLNPGFQAHALTILKHALKEFRPDQIILFGSRSEENRIGEINRLYLELTNTDEALETFIVEDLNELEQLEMLDWQEDEEQKVFIAPITRNFNLIHDFFRFLAFNELHEKSIVYGMTEWNSEKLFNYMNNFDVRLTSLWNPDVATNYSSFEESFFNRTGTLPNTKAYEGYGHIMIMGDLIEKTESGARLGSVDYNGLGMRAHLVDHNSIEFPGVDRSIEASYLENSYVHLLGFKNFRYNIISQ